MTRPAWDSEKADAGAAEFASKITPESTAAQIGELWRKYLPTVGHKRLGRALVAATKPAEPAPVDAEV